MIHRTPSFWYRQKPSPVAWALLPVAILILGLGKVAAWAQRMRGERVAIPVIAIGNITAGGTGKTPMVAALAVIAKSRGMRPVILMRGHGGRERGAVLVDENMGAEDVGDEAVMLHRFAKCNVVVARNRRAGAALILRDNLGDIILMDDAMQNHALIKNKTIACFNGRLGMGNGLPIPAGPLRAMPGAALLRVDAVAISGDDGNGIAAAIAKRHPHLKVFTIPRKLRANDIAKIKNTPVIAFAGIGDGEAFFDMLEAAGVHIAGAHAFADHAPIDDKTLAKLRDEAKRHGAVLVTTQKDAARIGIHAKADAIHAIGLEVDIPEALIKIIMPTGKGKNHDRN